MLALCVPVSGCAWFEHRPGIRVNDIDGIERIEYDGLDVTIYKTHEGKGSDKRMQIFISPGATGVGGIREAQSAAMRAGDVFYLQAKDGTLEEYELLSADKRDIAFRHQTARQQRDSRGEQSFTRVKNTVIRVKPYPIETGKEKKP